MLDTHSSTIMNYIYVYIYVCICMCVYVYVCVYIYIYMYIYVCMYNLSPRVPQMVKNLPAMSETWV